MPRVLVDQQRYDNAEGEVTEVTILTPHRLEEIRTQGVTDSRRRFRVIGLGELEGVELGTLEEGEKPIKTRSGEHYDESFIPAEGVEVAQDYDPDIEAPEEREVTSVQLFREDNEQGDNRAVVRFLLDGEESGMIMEYEFGQFNRSPKGKPHFFGSDRLRFELKAQHPDQDPFESDDTPDITVHQTYAVLIDGEVVGKLTTKRLYGNGEQQYFTPATGVTMDWSADQKPEPVPADESLNEMNRDPNDSGPRIPITSRRRSNV